MDSEHFKEELEYRISVLKYAVDDLQDNMSPPADAWEEGYRHGRLFQLQSELRFIKEMVK